MKLLRSLFTNNKQTQEKSYGENEQEKLIQLGREQFKKLVDRGLTVPVALL